MGFLALGSVRQFRAMDSIPSVYAVLLSDKQLRDTLVRPRDSSHRQVAGSTVKSLTRRVRALAGRLWTRNRELRQAERLALATD